MKLKLYFCVILLVGFLQGNNYVFSQACIGPLSINLIGSSTADSLAISLETKNLTCISEDNGQLILTVEGGNPNYQYVWDNFAGKDSIRYDLSEGTYWLSVIDSEGCTKRILGNIEQLNITNADLAMNEACGSCWLNNGESSYFFDANARFIAALADASPDMIGLEDTEVCVFMDETLNTCNGNPYLQRHWSINPTNHKEACLKLFFTQEEFDNLASGVTNETLDYQDLINNKRLCLSAFTGGAENCENYQTYTTYSMSDTNPLVVTMEDADKGIWSVEVCVEEYATFYLHVCDYVLPVELLYFTGKRNRLGNLLNWRTLSEINTSHFEIEKAASGLVFSYLEKLSAKGSSQLTGFYTYQDLNPSDDYDYYRLKIVDFDGTYKYSNVIAIYQKSLFSAKIYPNLFEENVYYEVELPIEDHLEIVVYDVIGQISYLQKIEVSKGRHKLEVKLEKLPAGIYMLQTYYKKQGISETFKLIKQRD